MTGRYSDDEALRPIGEATHVPDDRLASSDEPRRQRSESIDSGYPDTPTATETECASCGASIPASQSKCRFCLTNYLGDEAIETSQASDLTLLGIIHLVVESTTFYGAVAKGGAAATLLTANEAEPAVDDYTLIYDLNETLARQVTDRWPSLPDAVQVSSEEGAQLLSAACDRAGWHGRETSERQEQVQTPLYDQRGAGIREETRLKAIVDEANDELWLVPAIALTATTSERDSQSRPSPVPTTDRLECQGCGRATDHQFDTPESIPDETWSGQPIWECRRCGTARYGPAPE
ncbi:hypothetical protein [Halorubrum sp. AJ67]|uniref:biosurfactant protein 1 n=1 Tax=Halorubrum sp. AJ67 TaxID=1173487 RepID=UPI0003DC77DB|nr:hypothetical protein [Halorubrum sp. AJ67]CDK39175.1 uncharacterized protein BN903_158 [Halorubrum sp. AJ67]